MAAYEVLAHQETITGAFVYQPKKISFSPSYKIKKILKSVRKFFKKPVNASPIQFNGDASIMEILPSEQQESTVEINFFSEEDYQNMENERLEAQFASQSIQLP